ncbi:MAG: bifunctional folylpolyglutamate synthase/dihydrofolate synthase [Sarcina sp.]
MKYKEAMNYIANTSRFGMNFGLSRVEAMLSHLGNPQKNLKCIHIAGTNGKGSTTAMITSILKEEGYAVGMYTSPYLEEFEERIQINGINIPKEKLANLVTEIKSVIEKVLEKGFDNPTQFEIITTIMFLYFSREKVDYAIIEVGLGGRLDATNVINPIISVIGSISRDHMNILGDTIEEIAFEKCGIIKNAPVISYPQEPSVENIIKNVCKERDAKLILSTKNSINNIEINKIRHSQIIEYILNNRKLKIELKLLGKHQVLNALNALNVIDEFSKVEKHISDEVIKRGMLKTKWIGRMEVMGEYPIVLIDGAHNIDGIKNLKESVTTYFDYERLILILGVLGDKEVEKMTKDIAKISDLIILTEPHSERAKNINEMEKYILDLDKPFEKILNYENAYKKARKIASKADLILACGSLYMIGDMRKEIRNSKLKDI